MQLLPNNYNALFLRGVQLLDESTAIWAVQNAIPFSVTFYDPNGNPLSGLTALTIPNVSGSQGDYLKTLVIGNLSTTGSYRMVLTSTGGFAGYVTVDNQNVAMVTRAA